MKYRAFLPYSNSGSTRLETSIFRVINLSPNDISLLSDKARQDRKPKAIAHHTVRHIQEVNLELEPDNNPERHANIIGWPKEKHEQQDIARKLANKARLEKYSKSG